MISIVYVYFFVELMKTADENKDYELYLSFLVAGASQSHIQLRSDSGIRHHRPTYFSLNTHNSKITIV